MAWQFHGSTTLQNPTDRVRIRGGIEATACGFSSAHPEIRMPNVTRRPVHGMRRRPVLHPVLWPARLPAVLVSARACESAVHGCAEPLLLEGSGLLGYQELHAKAGLRYAAVFLTSRRSISPSAPGTETPWTS